MPSFKHSLFGQPNCGQVVAKSNLNLNMGPAGQTWTQVQIGAEVDSIAKKELTFAHTP